MNDIPRGTTVDAILRSLAPPVHTDATLNYDLISAMLAKPPVIQDSELDDDHSVMKLAFNDTPEWLRFLSGIDHGFPLKTQFGTLWRAVDMSSAGRDIHGRTAFVRAVIEGDLRYAEMLAEFPHAEVALPDKRGQTALHWACRKRLPEMVSLCFLLPGLDSNVRDNDGLTAFDIASRAADETIQALFYKNVLELEKTDPNAAFLRLLTVSSEPERDADLPDEALFGPVIRDQVSLVKALLASGANIAATNKDRETVLHLAAKRGSAQMLSALLQNSSRGVRADSEAVNNDQRTALHCAVQGGHLDAARVLINQGADKGARDSRGKTAIDLLQAYKEEPLKELLGSTWSSLQPLHRAVIEGRPERVKQQLRKGAKVNEKDAHSMTPLHHAAELGNPEVVKLLIDHGAKLNATNTYWTTPLHLVANGGHVEAMTLLLATRQESDTADYSRGADPRMEDYYSRTAMHFAAIGGHSKAVKLLHDHGGSWSFDAYHKTELHYTASMGHTETVELLLNIGAPVDLANYAKCRALSCAAAGGHAKTVILLLNRGASPIAQDECYKTALHHAAERGHNEGVKSLLNAIAPIDRTAALGLTDNIGRTAIYYAVGSGDVDTVLSLLAYGAVLDVNDSNGKTLLHYAARSGHTEIVGLLFDRIPISRRARLLEANDTNGRTALHLAAYHDYLDTVKFLLSCGASLETTDKLGKTPLSSAQQRGFSTVATFLNRITMTVCRFCPELSRCLFAHISSCATRSRSVFQVTSVCRSTCPNQ